MNICIVNGSPQRNGNTAEILKPFRQELLDRGARVEDIFLKEYTVGPCLECYTCQNAQGVYGCPQRDDAEEIFRRFAASDLVVLATPIFTWYCTAEMKALMDRHYGLNKFYRRANGQLIPSLSLALITTHGYEDDYANEPFETGVRRWCKHCHWNYLGRYSVRDISGKRDMQTQEAIAGARAFARELTDTLTK